MAVNYQELATGKYYEELEPGTKGLEHHHCRMPGGRDRTARQAGMGHG